MVDIIDCADALAEIEEIAYRSIDIIEYDMLGDKLVYPLGNHLLELILVGSRLDYLAQHLEGHLLVYAELCGVDIAVAGDIHHAVADDLDLLGLDLVMHLSRRSDIHFLVLDREPYLINARLFDLAGLVVGYELAGIGKYLACHGVCDGACAVVTRYSRGDTELLVVFIASERCKIVSLGIEEQHIELCKSAVHRRRLTGAELLVYLYKSFLGVLGGILLDDRLIETFILAEHIGYILIRAYSESADECRKGYFSVLVYPDVDNVIGIHFIFKPCAAVGDDSSLYKIFSRLVLFAGIVYSR